ncbi:hypothetical protein Acr_18g0008490 [Actinidia rufa]|uniref:Uncharacterized protein n=1 Tax=Actinidia rufa TaxID=165716 RepID=A0A7J0G7C7_9ERIC|nr:hypothetical protein Acr_18g0008490 [Actinidia rufa]
MDNAVVLLCKRGLVSLLYSLPGHLHCILDNDDDIQALLALALSRHLDTIDFLVRECGGFVHSHSGTDSRSNNGSSTSGLCVGGGDLDAMSYCDREVDMKKSGAAALSSDKSRAASDLIGRLIAIDVRVAPLKQPIELIRDMKEEFCVSSSYRRAWMAVGKARENVFGVYALSFKDLQTHNIHHRSIIIKFRIKNTTQISNPRSINIPT